MKGQVWLGGREEDRLVGGKRKTKEGSLETGLAGKENVGMGRMRQSRAVRWTDSRWERKTER